jgi:hypothetical protein
MLVSNLRIVECTGGAGVVADVSSERNAFETSSLEITLLNSSAAVIRPVADPFLPALLLPAMVLGEPLHLEGPVSPTLLENAMVAMDIYAAWVPRAQRFPILAKPGTPSPRAEGLGLFFSGGVDSFYSLKKHRDQITHLLMIQGFDIPLGDSATFETAASAVRRVADVCGKQLLIVRTNLKSFAGRFVPWGYYFGGLLGAVGLATQRVLRGCLIAASYSYEQLFPWGSHPLLDPLWSTENFRVIHDGCEARRAEKVKTLTDWDLAMETLRVCWESPGSYNCGQCEKCVRTMLALQAAGALGICRTLPPRLDPRAIARVRIRGEAARLLFEELVEALRCCPGNEVYVKAVRRAIRASVRERWTPKGLTRAVARRIAMWSGLLERATPTAKK